MDTVKKIDGLLVNPRAGCPDCTTRRWPTVAVQRGQELGSTGNTGHLESLATAVHLASHEDDTGTWKHWRHRNLEARATQELGHPNDWQQQALGSTGNTGTWKHWQQQHRSTWKHWQQQALWKHWQHRHWNHWRHRHLEALATAGIWKHWQQQELGHMRLPGC